MARHLTRMSIDKVSLVDAGANARRFAVLKRADTNGANGGDVRWLTPDVGIISKVTKTEDGKDFPSGDYAYVGDPDVVSTWKLRLTSTPGGDPDPRIVGAAIAALGPGGFRGQRVDIPDSARAAVVAKVRAAWKKAHPDEEASAMPDTISKADPVDTLRDELWQAMVEKDATGRPAPLVRRRAMFTKAIAKFRETAGTVEPVAKAGRPISAARLAQLKDAHGILGGVIAEAEPQDQPPPPVEGWGPAPEAAVAKENSMTPEELVEAVKPLIAEAVAAQAKPPEAPPEGEVTMADVVEALEKMAGRVEALEKSRSQSLPGQDSAPVTKSKQSAFAGIL